MPRQLSCAQTLVALSCGEAELLRPDSNYLHELGNSVTLPRLDDVSIDIFSDSSARSVARRRGVGRRLRHLRTRRLWLQSRVALGHLRLNLVAGEQTQQTRSRRQCQVARLASGQNMSVCGGCSSRSVVAAATANLRSIVWLEQCGSSRKSLNARGRGASGQVDQEAKRRESLLTSRWESWCFLDS